MRLLVVALLFIAPTVTLAQTPVRVATREVRPFVYQEHGELRGFSIELWEEISRRLKLKSEFVIKPTVQELLVSVKSNETALGISAISITAERAQAFDLSQPMFDSGLQILTPMSETPRGLFATLVDLLRSSSALPILVGVVATILVIAHAVWLFERRNPSGLAGRSYLPGIIEAGWWAVATLATQADQMPRTKLARVVAVLWMFASVVFIAYFTASVTSSLTVKQLRGDINGPEDLPGKRVASVAGSTSVEYLTQHLVDSTQFTKVEDAINALQDGHVDAVVYDAPILRYYASHEGSSKVETVGPIFRKESYGIVFPVDSPYRKQVNLALLQIKEDGTYDRLYEKWFGGAF